MGMEGSGCKVRKEEDEKERALQKVGVQTVGNVRQGQKEARINERLGGVGEKSFGELWCVGEEREVW